MNINTVEDGDVTVVAFQGKLDTNTAPEAQARLQSLVEDGRRKIIADFRELDYISSAGLRILLATAKKLRSSGGGLRFCNLNETVAEVFEISGFDTIFDLHPTLEDAREAF